MNLARMGSIARDTEDYNPFVEGQLRRRGAVLEKQGMLDLAKARREEKAAIQLAKDQAAEKEIMGQYIQGRDVAQNAPLGVVNPKFLEDSGMGPQPMEPKRTVAPVERQTMLDLAKVNPATAESFRMGRKTEAYGDEDRTRKIGFEQAEQGRKDTELGYKGRELSNAEKQQIIANNLDWFKAMTDRKKSETPSAFKPTPGQAAIDREFAKDIVAWSMGGAAAVQKDLKQLEEVIDEIAPKNKEGVRKGKAGISGPLIGLIPDRAKPALGLGRSLDIQERVQEVAQKNLREILGGQFAMKEGEQLIARAYNPRLSPEVNAQRIERLLPQMKAAAAAKEDAAQYFMANGTLAGYDLRRLEGSLGNLKSAIEGLDNKSGSSNVRDGNDEYEEYLRLKEQAGQ